MVESNPHEVCNESESNSSKIQQFDVDDNPAKLNYNICKYILCEDQEHYISC